MSENDGERTQPDLDTHSRQLDREHDDFWQSRGYPERPKDWETRDPSLPPDPPSS